MIILLLLLLVNTLVLPRMMTSYIQETDYGTFLRMLDERRAGYGAGQ